MNNKSICFIPARSGSKSIKDKNIVDLCGKPMMVHGIVQALSAKNIERVYVSSDSLEYLDIAKSYGATPIVRPKSISSDTSSTESAISHFLNTVNDRPDSIMLLQATSPLVTSEIIDGAMNDFYRKKSDSMVSVFKDHGFWWENNEPKYDPSNRPMRQSQKNL